ncbi:sep-like protein [Thalassiosira pseudonana CCMP1335]|jgi:hypothetical protein|uniref:Sep-like protein n=1 Tax=Thalassiosira pseudonana TaxID=35128 RepID=B8C2H9_THAPS|nr:sep-like protein [Thalassiosira pseudonana CCMP1335]EED92386.1 sep-like protein [Thalassiosira pseudonana CCMP1335]|eukprot:scaffold5351_cov199-Alexandrium_tamarense.AAC.11
MMNRFFSLLVILGCAASTLAFAPSSSISTISHASRPNTISAPLNNNRLITSSSTATSATALSERQWNFNSGRSPWGLKKNAEIWNGRVAQMAFTIVLLQELITGKGVVASIQDGDAVGFVFLGVAGVSTLGLTAWLALKGDESDIVF